MRFLDIIRSAAGLAAPVEERSNAITLDQWAQMFTFNGLGYGAYPMTTLGTPLEEPGGDFLGIAQGAYMGNGPVFAVCDVRMKLFSEARFQYQRMRNGRPGDLFGSEALRPLEVPFPGGTTRDLLARAMQDTDLAGNWFGARMGGGVRRLRPDWVTIILGTRQEGVNPADASDCEVVGYLYHPGGRGGSGPPETFLPSEVAHFAPTPDPSARYRGMSWLTPILREIAADRQMTTHQTSFLEKGAAQPLDAAILTPTGWRAMGDLAVGDEVTGPEGTPRRVVGVYPQGVKDIFRVTFSDGASTECCDDHLWTVTTPYDRAMGRTQTMPLRDFRDRLHQPSGAPRFAVPLVEPVEYADAGHLPLDPYVVGLMLGDGHVGRAVTVASHSEDAEETEAALAAAFPGQTIGRRDRGGNETELRVNLGHGGRLATGRGSAPSPLRSVFRDLGLDGVGARDKRIPDSYAHGRVGDRVALLQGLIDSDGHVQRAQAGIQFDTTSEALALGIADLARGLGGTASVADRAPGRNTRRVRISNLPEWIVPCRLSRKVADYRRPRKSRHRRIVSVELVRQAPAQCIRVDHPDGLYVTDDYIVTHNTPNMIVSLDVREPEKFKQWVSMFEANHEGAINAYKTLFLGAGASAEVVGSDFKQIDFKQVRGHGETRIAAAAGVPPIIAGFSEGLQAATYSNYGQARRRLADGTMRPLWGLMADALSAIVPVPSDARLHYDDRDIPFLQEDVADEAAIQATQAQTIRALVDGGFTPESAVAAVMNGDMTMLQHTGLFSVQLQPAGSEIPTNGNGDPARAREALARALAAR